MKNIVNEYTSRYYRGKENFNIKAYHSSRNLLDMCDIFYDGYLDPEAEHKGECPYDIIWFTIKNDDFDGPFKFSFEVDENTFKEMDFKWMNDIHLVTPHKIDIMDKRLRIEKINGVSVDALFERFYDKSSKDPVGDFIEHAFQVTNYEISNELFVMKLLQQYGFKRSDWFTYEDSTEMDESVIKEKQNNVIYYGVFLNDISKEKLAQLLPKDYYKVFCDHMTIAFKTQFTDEIVNYCNSLLGENIEMVATHIGKNEDVMAVKVETKCNSTNKTKHITLCTLSENGKPVQSNDITDWIKLKNPITLNGVVKAYPFTVKENKKYVRQGIIPYGDGEMCIGESEEQLNEVESSDISLKSFEIQDELNPKFWINNKINSRVRLKLLDLADEFIDSLAVDWVKPKDIVLTGSIANYNWSKYSDVDVHILMDFKEIWDKTEFVQDYFDSKKALWSQEHGQLKIYGFPVEMYVEDSNEDNPSSGVYSLNKNKWIKEPNDFQDAELNEPFIKKQAAKFMTEIDDIDEKIKNETDNHKLEVLSEKLKKLFDRLHKQRQESLDKHGEMGTYNIIWKVLRRSGHLDKIWDIINNVYNKVNSIKENKVKGKKRIVEAMKKGFSFEKLSKIGLAAAYLYCMKELGDPIGQGSSRAVFQIDDAQVLKLALDKNGVQQNKVEMTTKQMKSPLFPRILYCDNQKYKWIVAEYVLPLSDDDVEHCIGVDSDELFYYAIPAIKDLKNFGGLSAYDKMFVPVYGDSPFYRELAKYILNYDIPIGDICALANWGMTKRNGEDTLVILDSGWDKETMKMYGYMPSASTF